VGNVTRDAPLLFVGGEHVFQVVEVCWQRVSVAQRAQALADGVGCGGLLFGVLHR
jgi:hypothetical protein